MHFILMTKENENYDFLKVLPNMKHYEKYSDII